MNLVFVTRSALVTASLASQIQGCTPSPKGTSVDPQLSGLVGEWKQVREAATPASREPTSWSFHRDGTYEFHASDPGSAGRGRWRAYRSAREDPRPMVGFDEHPRRSPSCRFFRIDAETVPSGPSLRRQEWQGWVGEKHMVTERFFEDRP